MNGTVSSVADPYVQEFVLDTFSNVAVKPEIICPNPVGDSSLNDDAASTAAPTPSSASTIAGLSEEDYVLRHSTADSVIMSHSQMPHRLPPMSLLHSQASPPPHLLTPPDSQEDYYPPLHHHQIMSNLIIPGNLPDTPPINSPPLPPAIYHHLEHHHIQPQYSSLTALHHLHQPTGEVVEDMHWLSQSTDLHRQRQEPLDLRPHCTDDSVQNWNMMQHHTSVITGPGKRIYHTDYFHHQAALGQYPVAGQLPALSPLMNSPSTSSSASSSSSLSLSLTTTSTKSLAHNGLDSRGLDGRASSRSSSRGRARPGVAGKMQTGANSSNGNAAGKDRPSNPDVKIDDDLLLKINVRDLNVKLKGTTKDQQTKTKQRRRTLKNRIYAQNCRNKRNEQKTKLEIAKIQLEQDLKMEQTRVCNLQKDLVRLKNEFGKVHNEVELLRQKLRDSLVIASNNAVNRCSCAMATNLSVSSSVGEY